MKTPSNIAVIIPAAGASRRMGRPKQLLPWGKTTLLGHVVTEALQSEAKDVFVITGAYEAAIEKALSKYPVRAVHNPNWEAGLGTSIACGVRHLMTAHPAVEGVLVMLADQPYMDHQYLNTLIRHFRDSPDKIVATDYGNRAGVPAIFGTVYFKALSGLTDDVGAKYLLEKHSSVVIGVKPERELKDIDTMEDYRAEQDIS